MSTAEIVAFTAFAWIATFTPGPNVAIAATTGVNHGLRAAVPHMFGVTFGLLLMMWLTGLFGMSLLQHHPELVWGLKMAGNAYLLYLAWKLCQPAKLVNADSFRPFRLGQSVLFQFVNPKAWMMMAAAIPAYAIGHADFYQRMGWMSAGFALPCALSLLTWAWMGQALSVWLAQGSRLRVFNVCMGLSLAITALWMMTQ